jgi:trimeric autotransporter adhesin
MLQVSGKAAFEFGERTGNFTRASVFQRSKMLSATIWNAAGAFWREAVKMLNTKQKFKIAASLLMLVLLALIAGCNGFFVNPTLSSITITPSSPTLTAVNQTEQLTATGTYSDGTTNNITASSGTAWNSSDTAAVTINNTGLMKAISITQSSSVTITVTNTTSSGAVSGTATVCVGSTCTTSSAISVTCDQGTTISLSGNGGVGSEVEFTATQDGSTVSSTATWSSSNSSVISISSTGGGIASLEGTGTATITANVSGTTGTVTVTVTQ